MSGLAILPLLDRLDKVAKLLEKLLEKLGVAPEEKPLVVTIEAPVNVITQAKLSNRYKVLTVSLVGVLTDAPIGIKDLKPTTGYVPYLLITSIGGGFTYKINSSGADAMTASLGEEITDFEVEEIYLTCGAVGGNAIFYVEYRVD